MPADAPEYQEFWSEIENAKSQYRPNQTLNFSVDPAKGHDDFLMSLALVMEVANNYDPREAKGIGEIIKNNIIAILYITNDRIIKLN